MLVSLTVRKVEQFGAPEERVMFEKIAARTGSDNACRIPSTVMSWIEGWKRGLISFFNISEVDNSSNVPNFRTTALRHMADGTGLLISNRWSGVLGKPGIRDPSSPLLIAEPQANDISIQTVEGIYNYE